MIKRHRALVVIGCHPTQDKCRNTRNKQRVQTELFICMYVCIWHMAYMILRQYLKLMHHPSNSSAWPQCCQCLFSFNSVNHFYFCCSGLRKELLPSWPVCPQERDGETCLALHSGRAAATSQQQRSDARWWVRVWVPQGSNKQKNDVVVFFTLLQTFEALLLVQLLPSGVSAVARIRDFALSCDAWEKAPGGWDHPRCLCQRCRRVRN